MHKQINLVGNPEGTFLGASRDGLVARPVEMDKLSSSVIDRDEI
jgi:hypothetical protein